MCLAAVGIARKRVELVADLRLEANGHGSALCHLRALEGVGRTVSQQRGCPLAHEALAGAGAASISRMSGRCSRPQNNSPSRMKLGTPNTPFSSAPRQMRTSS